MSQPPPDWPAPLKRAGLIAAATLSPAVCGWSACAIASPRWQSLSVYVGMILSNTALAFAPFLLYASACLVLALCSPQRYLRHFGVRFGVYTGLVLSLHLILMWLGAIGGQTHLRDEATVWFFLTLGLLLPFLIGPALRFLKRCSARSREWAFALLAVTAVALVLVACAIEPTLVFSVLPGWCLLAFVRVAGLVYRGYGGRGQFRLGEALWLLTWAGTYMGTWRISVSRALEEYAKLPAASHHCYVCTAAARGHRRLVGAESIVLADGAALAVNRQMRRLKAAEIALKTLLPGVHAAVRAVYDSLGPKAAKCLRCPILADLAYLALKPVEWPASVLMRCLLADFDAAAGRLYQR